MARKSKKFIITKNLPLISGVAVVIIAVVALSFWHFHNRTSHVVINVTPTKTATRSQNSSSKQAAVNSTSDKSVATTNTAASASTQSPSNDSGGPPIVPIKSSFISYHKPGQNNSPTVVTSVCVTSPGASCYIKFTMGGTTTLQLQTGTADSNGSVYWNNWDVNNYAFSSGDWTITAVATLNGQTKTATDATPLTIQ